MFVFTFNLFICSKLKFAVIIVFLSLVVKVTVTVLCKKFVRPTISFRVPANRWVVSYVEVVWREEMQRNSWSIG